MGARRIAAMTLRDDNIVTTFCEVVTSAYIAAKLRRRRLVITRMGEAMTPAPESPPSGGNRSGAGAAPVCALVAWLARLALLAHVGCSGDAQPPPRPIQVAAPDRAAADPARGITTELDGAAPELGAALLAELTGDLAAARAGFEHLLAASDLPPPVAARAALHLAQLESRAGHSRRALELVARASALAPSDVAIAEGVAELQADVVAAAGAGDLRGPRLGTPLPGVSPRVAEAFAAAERALAQVHKLRPRPVLEAGSLYHDLALGLLFELPPELDPAVAAGLRRTLRGRAIAYLKKAVIEYRAVLSAPKHSDDELWRLAAETDLRGARDLLGEAGEK